MTDDDADLSILSLANDKRKFAIPLGEPLSGDQQMAFERGIDREWWTLVDVSPVAAHPRQLMRIFRLTDAGLARLAELGRHRIL